MERVYKSRRPNLTETEKVEIRELWKSGASYEEIQGLMNCSYATVRRAIRGREPERKKAPETSRVCPECKGKLLATGAILFCYHCGADIRSEGAKLVPELRKILANISTMYPAAHRDHAVATLNDAIKILKG